MRSILSQNLPQKQLNLQHPQNLMLNFLIVIMFSTLLICLDLMIAATCNILMVTPTLAALLFIQLVYIWDNRD